MRVCCPAAPGAPGGVSSPVCAPGSSRMASAPRLPAHRPPRPRRPPQYLIRGELHPHIFHVRRSGSRCQELGLGPPTCTRTRHSPHTLSRFSRLRRRESPLSYSVSLQSRTVLGRLNSKWFCRTAASVVPGDWWGTCLLALCAACPSVPPQRISHVAPRMCPLRPHCSPGWSVRGGGWRGVFRLLPQNIGVPPTEALSLS